MHQPVPIYLPAHHKVCTRYGIWLSDAGQPHLDLAACPEMIITGCTALSQPAPTPLHVPGIDARLSGRALRRVLPGHHNQQPSRSTGGVGCPPCRPPTTVGTPTGHDAYTHAAIYPDAIALTAAALNPRPPARSSKIHWRTLWGLPRPHQPRPEPSPPLKVPHPASVED